MLIYKMPVETALEKMKAPFALYCFCFIANSHSAWQTRNGAPGVQHESHRM